MGSLIFALFCLILAVGAIVLLIKGAKERKAKGILKSLFGMKFVKGIPDLQEGQNVGLYLYKDKITLDDNQIIPLERIKKAVVFTEKELKLKDKSVIGRAALGGLLLGPLGAVVGGVSGVGDKKKEKTLIFLSVEYTDKDGENSKLVFLAGDGAIGLNGFASRVNKMVGIVQPKITEAYEI